MKLYVYAPHKPNYFHYNALHAFILKTYFLIQNPIIPTEPVFGSLPFSKTSLAVTLSGMVRVGSLDTSNGLKTQNRPERLVLYFFYRIVLLNKFIP